VDDVYEINLETLESKVLAKKKCWMPAINSHTAVLNPETKKVYIYGGFTKHSPTSDVYEFDIASNEWIKLSVTGPIPLPRSSHTACFYQGSMIIFGGINANGDFLSDLWIFNLTDHTWKNVDYSVSEVVPAVVLLNNIRDDKDIQ